MRSITMTIIYHHHAWEWFQPLEFQAIDNAGIKQQPIALRQMQHRKQPLVGKCYELIYCPPPHAQPI